VVCFDATRSDVDRLGHLGELLPFTMERFDRPATFFRHNDETIPIQRTTSAYNLWITTSGNVARHDR